MAIQITFNTQGEYEARMYALDIACTFIEGYLATRDEDDSMVNYEGLMELRNHMLANATVVKIK